MPCGKQIQSMSIWNMPKWKNKATKMYRQKDKTKCSDHIAGEETSEKHRLQAYI